MRSRNIKPSFFVNDVLGGLPFEARLLFAGLWCKADREGRLPDIPKRIRGELFPYDDVDVEASLDALAVGGLIARYTIDDRKVIQVINFLKHQNPHRKEAKSVLPPQYPNQGNESFPGKGPTLDGDCPADSGFLIPDSSYSLGEGEENSPRANARDEQPSPPAPTVSERRHDEITALSNAYAKAMIDAGVTRVNPMHPELASLAEARVPVAEVAATAREKVAEGKTELKYIINTITGRRRDAQRLDGVPRGVRPAIRSAAHKAYAPKPRNHPPAEMPASAKELAKKLGVVFEGKPIEEPQGEEE